MQLVSHHKLVMNNYAAIGGDLTNIFQAGASPVSDVKVGTLPSSSLTAGWGDLASISCNSNAVSREDFSDPFSNTGDSLLRDGDAPPLFTLPFVEGENGRCAERIKAPSSYGVFSRILQITATPSKASPLGGDISYANSRSLLTSTMTENHGMMRVPSPRNNPSMKRRKIQGKKVVCIPAPSPAANSRPSSGEVVPSDLWAWRKYGQKPIKGSPFPRGYYRCSSSKGCSARKQVERSRTDPNMLVITYTSEHNHPWPSQRNALAGLTRSTSKGSSGSKNSANISSRTVKSDVVKGEKRNGNSSDDNMSCTAAVAGGSSVKEETDNVVEKPFDSEDAEFVGVGLAHCYRPLLMDRADHHPDDFFADLGEIVADPYELLFKQGFLGDDRNRGNMSTEYPFSLLDWADDNN